MTNRKATTATTPGESTTHPQENFNAVYTAHQVHTIANMIYRQMTGGWKTPSPWSPAMGAATPHSFMGSGNGPMPGATAVPVQTAPAGFANGPGPLAPPALFYWYP